VGTQRVTSCPGCRTRITQPNDPGRKRQYCSNACRQAAYRARKLRAQQDAARARAQAGAAGAAGGGAGRDWWEEQAAWTWAPPNPGNGPVDPAERARRVIAGLEAKAARTTFPHEADACRAKAEQLRRKYAL